MQLTAEQLPVHLEKASRGSGLKPVYIVMGDEYLLVMEACDALRKAARALGFTARELFTVDTSFKIDPLLAACSGGSLFGDKTLIDLRMPSGKPGKELGKALEQLAGMVERSGGDACLLVTLPKLKKTEQNVAWFAALAAVGVVVQCDPPALARLPDWIGQRMAQQGLSTRRENLQWLAEHCEGNLLAASQEIQKLRHMVEGSEVDTDTLQASVANVARYNAFELSPASLAGDHARVARMLDGLKAEGVATVLVLWGLQEDIRALFALRHAQDQGTPLGVAIKQARIWGEREKHIEKAVRRHSKASLTRLQHLATDTDRAIKGLHKGDPWRMLLALALGIGGLAHPEELETP